MVTSTGRLASSSTRPENRNAVPLWTRFLDVFNATPARTRTVTPAVAPGAAPAPSGRYENSTIRLAPARDGRGYVNRGGQRLISGGDRRAVDLQRRRESI